MTRDTLTKSGSILRRTRFFLVILIIWIVVAGLFYQYRPNPPGIGAASAELTVPEENVRFLHDLTYENSDGTIVYEQAIFDTIFSVIEKAREYILVDMFLFNSDLGKLSAPHRELSGELTKLLIRKKQDIPDIKIDFIADDINNVYGGAPSPELALLRNAGVNVIVANLDRLHDSNMLYSPFWRAFIQWFGNSGHGGLFPHPFADSGPKVTLRSYLALLNFKANHRKVILADNGAEPAAFIISANCHDASSAHSNIGVMVSGEAWKEIYRSEQVIAELSGSHLQEPEWGDTETGMSGASRPVHIRVLTEQSIKHELIKEIDSLGAGDFLSMAMFYLSERDIIGALIAAAGRGGVIRIVLDPSMDAFGYEKHGIPNTQSARELHEKSRGNIAIRWYNTHGEQFHSKLVYLNKKDGTSVLFAGSANLTRRNICNYNLELDAMVSGTSQSVCLQEVSQYFDRLWSNKDGNQYTLNYEHYGNTSFMKAMLTKAYESFGLSTF
jgi:hypothetical protein